MFNFLLGFVFGWLAGSWYTNMVRQGDAPYARLRERAGRVFEESSRLVGESRQELRAAVGGGGGRQRGRNRGPARAEEGFDQTK